LGSATEMGAIGKRYSVAVSVIRIAVEVRGSCDR